MNVLALCAFACLVASAKSLVPSISLEDGFKAPPSNAKPHTWYHMMNGNVTKEGITCDFEAIAKAGIGGVQIFDVGCKIPPGPVKFNSKEWFDVLQHAHREAKRLGLEICISNCSGCSSSGGPWNTPDNAMKIVVFSETSAKGPMFFDAVLPRTKKDNGFYEDIAVLAYPTPKRKTPLSNLDAKILAERGNVSRDKNVAAKDEIIAKDSIVDLTSQIDKDGRLKWSIPTGNWKILRIGCICNGRRNHPASERGYGLEVDKLSAKAMDHHFGQYIGRICKRLGVEPGIVSETGLNNVLVDSYEVGMQNWTRGFDKIFEKKMGYSPVGYLPVFAGWIVGGTEESERFLEDFRRVVADLFARNYAGRLAHLCRENGLMLSLEPYGNGPFDNLQYGQYADIPMSEFWSQSSNGDHGDLKVHNARLAASLSHVWGRRYAAAESFTAGPETGGRWLTTPFSIKSQGDRAYANGVNRIVYHRFTHQPWPGNKYLPGMTMGRWGMHLDRTQTWWPLASDWFAYQARCQWMLQEGVFVADVLFWCGETTPIAGTDTRLPFGYDFDYCSTDAFMRLKVENGRIVSPGGVAYNLLVLPNTDTLSISSLEKIGELLDAGAKISSVVRPCRTPGLANEVRSGKAYETIVDSVWSKGVMAMSASDALSRLGIKPDFAADIRDVAWIHRKSSHADWYFVALDNHTNTTLTVSMRQTGRIPEIWNPLAASVEDAPVWREENGRTFVTLSFSPSGSAFVVFRKPSEGVHLSSVRATVATRKEYALLKRECSLKIIKAEYGVFEGIADPVVVDITSKVASHVSDGEIDICVDNRFAGRDPLVNTPKKFRVTYIYDGNETTETLGERTRFAVPKEKFIVQPPPTWEWCGGKILAWQPMSANVAFSDGVEKVLKCFPPESITVDGSWSLSFPEGWSAPERVVLEALVPWNEHEDDGIKYFSGTATYAKTVKVGEKHIEEGRRIMLDLGVVKNFAQVTVNGRAFPVLWKPPYRLDITDAVDDGGSIGLEIKVTNLWPNRLIGDERLFAPDCEWVSHLRRGNQIEHSIKAIPDWVKEGKRSPTARHTFTTWRHWSKNDKVFPSGLIGPVRIRFGEFAE